MMSESRNSPQIGPWSPEQVHRATGSISTVVESLASAVLLVISANDATQGNAVLNPTDALHRPLAVPNAIYNGKSILYIRRMIGRRGVRQDIWRGGNWIWRLSVSTDGEHW
jgi:hypothetical protein